MSELGFGATGYTVAEEADPFSAERLARREVIDELAGAIAKKASAGTRFYTRFLNDFKDRDGGHALLSLYELDTSYAPSRWYLEQGYSSDQPLQASPSGLLLALPDNRLAGVEVLKYSDVGVEGGQEVSREEYLVVYDEAAEDFKLRRYSNYGEKEESFVDLSHDEAQGLLHYIATLN